MYFENAAFSLRSFDEAGSEEYADATARDPGRLAALRSSCLLDTEPEPAFDRLTLFTSQILQTPTSVITLIDENRQFFKSQCGCSGEIAERRQNPLSYSFCKYVVAAGQPLSIEDARLDASARLNPAVTELGVVAYLGVPITLENGERIGTICVFDIKPRQWTKREVEILQGIAAQVMTEIRLRTRSIHLMESLDLAQRTERNRQSLMRMSVHDLRSPLGSLLLCIDLLPTLGPLTPAQSEFIGICGRSGSLLKSIVESLLDIESVAINGAQALRLEPIEPGLLIRFAHESVVGLAAERKIKLTSDPEPGLCAVMADREKFARVLINLLANAIKFTPSGGAVNISAEADREHIRFSVRDTGPGIPTVELNRIFEEGVFLDADAPSSFSNGLGLAYCKRMIDAHCGDIRVESSLGNGSTFTVRLPVKPGGTGRD